MSWCGRKYVVWMVLAALIWGCHVECCTEDERLALLDLNSYFRSQLDPYNAGDFRGLSYGEEDKYNCCTWSRVRCNPTTQRITELDLYFIMLGLPRQPWVFNVTMLQPFRELTSLYLSDNHIGGLVEKDGSTELLTLKDLRSLSLSANDFKNGPIFLNALTSLEKLFLSLCHLNDSNFPLQGICELKNLTELHLYGNDFYVLPSCLHNLSSLRVVDLTYNQIKGRLHDIPFNLVFLRHMSVSNTGLEGLLLPSIFQNLTSLEHLDLSDNHFEGTLSLNSFANLSKLQYLDLSGSQVEIEDSLWQPSFQLQHLGLRGCGLNISEENIPRFLSQQHNLSYINLSYNNLSGSFPFWISGNSSLYRDLELKKSSTPLPQYSRRPLHTLIISHNNFHGKLPENIGFLFPQLRHFTASGCHFEGSIPVSMRDLIVLVLSFNNLSGQLPAGFLNSTTLGLLDLSGNNLQGEIIPEDMNLPQLQALNLSNNCFDGTIKDAIRSSSRLMDIDISNNKVTGSLPSWIGDYHLHILSVSNNVMQGHIPLELCKLQSLKYLDLSQNNFTGPIPSCSNLSLSLEYMFLGHNNLEGAIPSALSSASSLKELDLRENQLSGGIPPWINRLSKLQVLLLGRNNFHSQIPKELCQLQDVDILDLSRNHLSGMILPCFANMSFGFKAIFPYDLGGFGIGEGNNDFYGIARQEMKLSAKNQYLSYIGGNLRLMSLLDLSCNKLDGVIPSELGDLIYVQSLNLSHNSLIGSIPSSLSNLKAAESLDLSFNKLSGMIPDQLVELNFLEVFNVSFNNLIGRTPEAGQFGNFDEKSYLRNPGLCVSIVNKSCSPILLKAPTSSIDTTTSKEDGYRGGLDMEDFLWSFGMTSFVAFVTTIMVLGINPQWREAWFDFVEWHLLWWLL